MENIFKKQFFETSVFMGFGNFMFEYLFLIFSSKVEKIQDLCKNSRLEEKDLVGWQGIARERRK